MVAAATWYVAQSGEMSPLLFYELMLSGWILSHFGQTSANVWFIAAALVGALLFFVPVGLRRTPTTPDQIARFNRWTCLWLLVCLGALVWFGGVGDFAL